VDKLQPDIVSCTGSGCEHYDSEIDRYSWFLGNETNLEDLLEERAVPNQLRDEVVESLSCRNCGRSDFERTDDIGTPTDAEIDERKRWSNWHSKYADKVESFGEHLKRYPYLGLNHPIGRSIAKTIGNFPRARLKAGIWWRARGADGPRVFQTKDMLPPRPADAKAEGRFNHFGQSVFYLAEHERGALAEIAQGADSVLGWVQQFRVPAQQNLFDLTQGDPWRDSSNVPILAMGLVSTLRDLLPSHTSAWKPEYFIPRFIADCARQAGVTGIVFESPRRLHSNLVLFDWDEKAIVPEGKPEPRTWNRLDKTDDAEIDF
jgi:hypothetical protein